MVQSSAIYIAVPSTLLLCDVQYGGMCAAVRAMDLCYGILVCVPCGYCIADSIAQYYNILQYTT
eukprot:580912-Rhodomonas_salina.1